MTEIEWLPVGAKRIEYLQSDGNQWIDTNFKATNGYIQECECYLTTYTSIVTSHDPNNSASNGYNRNYLEISANAIQVCKCDHTNTFSFSFSLNTKYKLYLNTVGNNYICNVNDISIVNTTDNYIVNSLTSIKIFKIDWQDGKRAGRLYNLKIWNNTTELVRNFIPIRIGQIGYLFDKVTNQLFSNSGTGDFTLGPDI